MNQTICAFNLEPWIKYLINYNSIWTLTLVNKFIINFIAKMITNLPNLERKQKSMTQTMSPLYRKLSGLKVNLEQKTSRSQVSMDIIRDEYSTLSTTIDRLQQALNNRMHVHEKELIIIMKQEINRMLEDVRKVVKVFNAMIKEKNFSQDLWETRNEMQYFKFEAFRLFQENKSLQRQIDSLKKQIQSLNFQQKCQTIALKRLAKKLVKEKAIRNGNKTNHDLSSSKSPQLSPMIKNRKRHESLYSTLQKNTSLIQQKDEQRNPQQLKSYIESTISQTKGKDRVKTEHDQSIDINEFQYKGHSERVDIKNGSGKLNYLKNRISLCKKKFKEHQQQLQDNPQQNKGNE